MRLNIGTGVPGIRTTPLTHDATWSIRSYRESRGPRNTQMINGLSALPYPTAGTSVQVQGSRLRWDTTRQQNSDRGEPKFTDQHGEVEVARLSLINGME